MAIGAKKKSLQDVELGLTGATQPKSIAKSPSLRSARLEVMAKKIDDLKRDVVRVSVKYSDHPYVKSNEYDLKDVERIALCWSIKTEKTLSSLADRTRSMLAGPLFSCAKFPWPRENRKPMLPVTQVDLRLASKLRGLPLGDGLLQVFLGPSMSNWEVRVVPRDVVDLAKLSKVPPIRASDEYFVPTQWSEPDGEFDAISGFSGPKISSNVQLEEPKRLPQELRKTIQDVNAIKGNDFGFHMFGTFYPNQYGPSERPPCLMLMDSKLGYFWGRFGCAQVFYEIREDGVEFSFEMA